MASLSTENERQEIEDDIERIKSALRSSGGEWQLSLGAGVGESESDDDGDDDCLQIDDPDWEPAPGPSQVSKTVKSAVVDDSTPPTKKRRVSSKDIEDVQESVEDLVEDSSQTSVELIQMSVALNKAYQEIIVENLETIRIMLAQNKEYQEDVQHKLAEDLANRGARALKIRKKTAANYGYPYFRDRNGIPPPMNYDTRAKQTASEPDPYQRPAKSWNNNEKKRLRKAINEDILKQTLQPHMNRRELDMDKLLEAKNNRDDEDKAAILKRLEEHQQQITLITENGLDLQATADYDMEKIDWLKISVIDFHTLRRPDECFIFWRNHLHPGISNARWTTSEDIRLTEVVEKHGGRKWESISRELGTDRSAFQCLQRFQNKLNPCLQTGKWSVDEDTFLKEVISSLNIGDNIPWGQVAYYMEGRSDEQCEQRWEHLHNVGKMGRWTEQEDKLLLSAVERFGKEWVKVKDLVPERNAKQCRERYMNTLQRNTKTGFWRYCEDKTLWIMYEDLGDSKWAQICAEIPGRSDNACLQRHRVLVRLKHIEDIILQAADGQTIVDKLMAKGLVMNQAHKPFSEAKEIRIRSTKKKIAIVEKTVLELERKAKLLVVNSRMEKHYRGKLKKSKSDLEELKDVLQHAQDVKPMNTNWDELKNSEIKHDNDQAIHDRDNGIYVPRPLLGVRGLRNSVFADKDKLKEVIEHRTNKMLRESPAGQVNSDMTSIKVEKIPAPPKGMKTGPKVKVKVESQQMSPVNIRRRGKKRSMVDEKVEVEIMELLNIGRVPDNPTGRRKIRPDPDEIEEPQVGLDMEHKVFKILVSALNIDIEGATRHSRKLMKEQKFDEYDPDSRTLRANLKLFESALNRDLGTPQYVEPGSGPTSSLPNVCLQMLPRRALQGINAEKAYRLPPLPPTVSTLQAFKSLLLQRRDLLSLASKQQKIGSNPDGNAPVKRKKGPVGRDAVVRGRHGRQSKVFPGMETKQPDHTDDATDATAAEQMPASQSLVNSPIITKMKMMAVASTRQEADESLAENDGETGVDENSTTVGENSTTVGENSTTMGENSTTVGENSTTVGENSTTMGENSTTMGENCTTVGENSIEEQAETTGPASTKKNTIKDVEETTINHIETEEPQDGSPGNVSSNQVDDKRVDETDSAPNSLSSPVDETPVKSKADKQNIAGTPPVHAGSTFHSSHAFRATHGQPLSPSLQPRIMVLKGSDLSPATLTQLLKSKGVIADPQKVKMQLLNRSNLAESVIKNNSINDSDKIQTKTKRKKALEILRKTHDYQLLKARFKSLFLWPALLSTIPFQSIDKEKDALDTEAETPSQSMVTPQRQIFPEYLIPHASVKTPSNSTQPTRRHPAKSHATSTETVGPSRTITQCTPSPVTAIEPIRETQHIVPQPPQVVRLETQISNGSMASEPGHTVDTGHVEDATVVLSSTVVPSAVVQAPVGGASVMMAPGDVPPVTEHQAMKVPIMITPTMKAPAVNTQTMKTPAVNTPTMKTPAVNTPTMKTPAVNTPTMKTPAVATPTMKSPMLLTPILKSPMLLTPSMKSRMVLTPTTIAPVAVSPTMKAPQVVSPGPSQLMVLEGSKDRPVDIRLSKKHLTRKNRYPCTMGNRFRRNQMKRTGLKEEQRINFRRGHLQYTDYMNDTGDTSMMISSQPPDMAGKQQQKTKSSKDVGSSGGKMPPMRLMLSGNSLLTRRSPRKSKPVRIYDIVPSTEISQTIDLGGENTSVGASQIINVYDVDSKPGVLDGSIQSNSTDSRRASVKHVHEKYDMGSSVVSHGSASSSVASAVHHLPSVAGNKTESRKPSGGTKVIDLTSFKFGKIENVSKKSRKDHVLDLSTFKYKSIACVNKDSSKVDKICEKLRDSSSRKGTYTSRDGEPSGFVKSPQIEESSKISESSEAVELSKSGELSKISESSETGELSKSGELSKISESYKFGKSSKTVFEGYSKETYEIVELLEVDSDGSQPQTSYKYEIVAAGEDEMDSGSNPAALHMECDTVKQDTLLNGDTVNQDTLLTSDNVNQDSLVQDTVLTSDTVKQETLLSGDTTGGQTSNPDPYQDPNLINNSETYQDPNLDNLDKHMEIS